jgi:hypothetical protein
MCSVSWSKCASHITVYFEESFHKIWNINIHTPTKTKFTIHVNLGFWWSLPCVMHWWAFFQFLWLSSSNDSLSDFMYLGFCTQLISFLAFFQVNLRSYGSIHPCKVNYCLFFTLHIWHSMFLIWSHLECGKPCAYRVIKCKSLME